MTTKDQLKVERYRKAFPEESKDRTDRECLYEVKMIFGDRKQFNKMFSKLINSY